MSHPLRFALALVAIVSLQISCASSQKLLEADVSTHEHAIGLPPERTFDALVSVAMTEGFEVDEIDKSAGLLRLEPKSLTPAELDEYCSVPLVYSDSGQPVSTFAEHDKKLRDRKDGKLTGSVAMSILVSRQGMENSNVKIRSDYRVKGPERKAPCASKGALEEQLFGKIERELLAPR